MNSTSFNKKQLIKYLLSTFVIAWIMQFGAYILTNKGLAIFSTLLLSVMMLVPLLGVVISGYKLKNIFWKPIVKGNIIPILIAWFSPILFTFAGALLYFVVFQKHFDLSGKSMIESIGENAFKQMEQQGITFPIYILISIVSCVTYAPFLNMFFAMGEEVGWRGFLYPQLKAKFGIKLGYVFGGIIWGIWHWPLIWLIGYEYGTEYFGFPISGMLLFCLVTVALGTICDWLYEKSKCIWVPSIFHGSFNAAASLPILLSTPNIESYRLLGPFPNGLISCVPLVIFALILFFKSANPKTEE